MTNDDDIQIVRRRRRSVPPSVSIGVRLPKYNEVGCLMNLDETTNWSFMKEILPGEHIDTAGHPNIRTSTHVMATRYGKVCTVRTLANGDIRIICLE